ncbi:hypothetical protein QBC37DRAFT_407067 [Rhypophila decipiens]|uniref:Uncharacterized protein n=1 Tax=Rhypophila decipiens TaxID=261697 RepID=A0AAN7B165_9PEZI|nr:hypothetical protein QBC37DRAFT_407067 [Rhypophila decipiens]
MACLVIYQTHIHCSYESHSQLGIFTRLSSSARSLSGNGVCGWLIEAIKWGIKGYYHDMMKGNVYADVEYWFPDRVKDELIVDRRTTKRWHEVFGYSSRRELKDVLDTTPVPQQSGNGLEGERLEDQQSDDRLDEKDHEPLPTYRPERSKRRAHSQRRESRERGAEYRESTSRPPTSEMEVFQHIVIHPPVIDKNRQVQYNKATYYTHNHTSYMAPVIPAGSVGVTSRLYTDYIPSNNRAMEHIQTTNLPNTPPNSHPQPRAHSQFMAHLQPVAHRDPAEHQQPLAASQPSEYLHPRPAYHMEQPRVGKAPEASVPRGNGSRPHDQRVICITTIAAGSTAREITITRSTNTRATTRFRTTSNGGIQAEPCPTGGSKGGFPEK